MGQTNMTRNSRWRYRVFAPVYDVVSLERLLYRAGREAGVRAAGLRPGQQVLDVGCGTGLSLPLLAGAVGPRGRVIGLDPNAAMLRRAARRHVTADSILLHLDATTVRADDLTEAGVCEPAQTAFFGYSLSVMPNWPQAWTAVTSLLAPRARVVVIDVAPPTRARYPVRLAASIFTRLGGSDITARPWQALQKQCEGISHQSFCGGHIQVWAGTLR